MPHTHNKHTTTPAAIIAITLSCREAGADGVEAGADDGEGVTRSCASVSTRDGRARL